MRKLVFLLSLISINYGQIILNEIMVNPSGSEYENEFVEVYNLQNTSYSLEGCLISDGIATDTLTHFSGPDSITTNAYALIIDPGLPINDNPYFEEWPDSLAIYTLKDNSSFGSGGFSNSQEDVILLTHENVVMDSFSWTQTTENGHSWERILTSLPSVNTSWRESIDYNGTPGQLNSVTPPIAGFQIDSLHVQLLLMPLDTTVTLNLYIRNVGQSPLPYLTVKVFNNNHLIEELSENRIVEYGQNDSISISFNWAKPGENHFLLALTMNDSLEMETREFQINLPFEQNILSITEVLFSPNTEQGGEYFELHNICSDTVSLKNWFYKDAGQTWRNLTHLDRVIPPDSFMICAQDQVILDYFLPTSPSIILESWATLNSSSDSIVLADLTGKTITSIFYRGSWGETGKSLERRHYTKFPFQEFNWKSSQHPDGGTPGFSNTVNLATNDVSLLAWQKNYIKATAPGSVKHTLSIENTGYETITNINISLLSNSVSLFALQWVGTLNSFEETSLFFNTYEMEGGLIYLNLSLTIQDSTSKTTTDSIFMGYPSTSVIFNEFLAHPTQEQTEFIECFVNATDSVDVTHWTLQDRTSSTIIPPQSTKIPPQSYILFAPDISLFEPSDQVTRIEINPWPSLNNSNDDFLLLDGVSHNQDSLFYTSEFPLATGVSAERKASWLPSNTPSSWSLSDNSVGYSAGQQNTNWLSDTQIDLAWKRNQSSISRLDSIYLVLIISGQGQYGGSDIEVEIQAFGETHILYRQIPEYGQRDSIILHFPPQIPSWQNCVATIESLNLSDTLTVAVEPNIGDMLLNEFLVYPESGEAEWLEILNVSHNDIPLNLMMIGDNSNVSPVNSSLSLPAGKMVIISQFLSQESCIDASLFQWSNFGNISDMIKITTLSGQILDSLTYDNRWPIVQGISMERKSLSDSTLLMSNWAHSLSGNSLCMRNSILPPLSNVAIESITCVEPVIIEEINFHLNLVLNNASLVDISESFIIELLNNSKDVIFSTEQYFYLNHGKRDTLMIEIENTFLPGSYTIRATLANDDIASDNNGEIPIYIGFETSPFLLTEFQVYDSPVGEWVEIVNRHTNNINLQGWFLGDADGHLSSAIDSIFLEPSGYFVLSKEAFDDFPSFTCKNWPDFKNETDGIFLFSPDSQVQDSLFYDKDWPLSSQYSCERISFLSPTNSKLNWNYSLNTQGHSAGQQNSLYLKKLSKDLVISYSSNPWSINSTLNIYYELPFSSAYITVEIFDMAGRKIKTLALQKQSPHKGMLFWNGITDWNRSISTGLYLVYFYVINSGNQTKTCIQKLAIYSD